MAKDSKNSVKDKKTLVENPFTGRLVNPKYLEKVLKKKKILQQNTKKIPSRNANKLYSGGGMLGMLGFKKAWQKDESIHANLNIIKDKLDGINGISHDLDYMVANMTAFKIELKSSFLKLIEIFTNNSEWYKNNKIFNGTNLIDVGDDISIAINQFIVIRRMFWDSMTNMRRYMIEESQEIRIEIRNIYKETFPDGDANINALELYYDLIRHHNPPTDPPTKADDIIPLKILKTFEKYRLYNTVNTLSSCRDLLNTYITTLETFSKTKVGGRKMKALKSPNTPKKTIPKKTIPKKAIPKKASIRK